MQLLTIHLGVTEEYDSELNEFISHDLGEVRFEYSLKAIYEWEAKWRKPFLSGKLTDDEWIDFYRSMALDSLPEGWITYDVVEQLNNYITDSHTATIFTAEQEEASNKAVKKKGKFYTAEELYAQMITATIPLEFENRNLNRLLTILRIISLNNEPPKKMSKNEVLKQNTSLNEQRKAMLKTKG